MADLRLEELSASNIAAANSLTLKPGQEQFVAPESYAAAAETTNQSTTWQRVVIDGDDEIVGFIGGNFDEDAAEEFRSCLWRINVDARAQGKGVGKFAVHALAKEARSRGFEQVTVIWESGDLGPEAFFLRIGFSPIGETQYGETIGALSLA